MNPTPNDPRRGPGPRIVNGWRPQPWVRAARRAAIAAVGGFTTIVMAVAAMLGVSGAHPQPDTHTATEIPAAVLRAYSDAADSADIPWPVLAGIGYVQSDHGRTAPGETIARHDPGDPPSDRPTGAAANSGRVWLVGDSLMVGVAATATFPAATNRAHSGDTIAQQLVNLTAAARAHAPVVFVSLGTNDTNTPNPDLVAMTAAIDRAMAATGGAGCVVWSTVQTKFAPTSRYGATIGVAAPRFNQALTDTANRYPQVRVVDWAAQIDTHPAWNAPDGLHLTAQGYQHLAAAYRDTATTCPHDGAPIATGRLSPDLTPPITTPGWGLYLADGPDILTRPQNLDGSSQQIADRLAELIDARTTQANLDDDRVLGVFDTDNPTRDIAPAVWHIWVDAIDNLPLTPAPTAAAGGGLGEAAMTRAAHYAAFTPPTGAATPAGNIDAAVPYAAAFNTAGATNALDPRMLAAIAQTESGFDPAVMTCQHDSAAGAKGIMQLLAPTAHALGVDPCQPDDAIAGAARMLRHLYDEFRTWPLAWAAYNAGEGAVLRYAGLPPYPETRHYIERVQTNWDQLRARYPTALPPTPAACTASTGPRSRAATAVQAACSQLGVAYVWGGETPGRAMDCSGLAQWAWRQAGVTIARVTWDQMRNGTPVANLDQARPGDLIFLEGGAHVGLYLGDNQMIHAPHPGDVVKIAPVYATPTAIRRPA